MDVTSLRQKHPVVTYKSFDYQVIDSQLSISFHFHLEPDIDFHHQLKILLPKSLPHNLEPISFLIFSLGLVELLSYWKATCSPVINVETGYLSQDQVSWWQNLLIKGLGEFFYVNQIEFWTDNFISIQVYPSTSFQKELYSLDKKTTINYQLSTNELILVGGGKDSVVTMELLKKQPGERNVLLVNPTVAATATAQAAGFTDPIIVTRTIDPKLLELNKQGYLNGHIPFSAMLAFLSQIVAIAWGFSDVIVSNESSASEGSLEWHDHSINHQYSKSWQFEQNFKKYVANYLNTSANYYSLLRPLSELQITALFSKSDAYDALFSSCNVTRNNDWCGDCPKCAFVFLMMSAILPPDRIKTIFGPDTFFDRPSLKEYFFQLVGLSDTKPLDCIGTIEESQQAVWLSIDQLSQHNQPIPKLLSKLSTQLGTPPNISELRSRLKTDWDAKNSTPEKYQKLIKQYLNHLH